MPHLSPDDFIWEEVASPGGPPDRLGWISEAGGLTQFGAFVEILQPGSRTSKKHWHLAEDELVYVLEGEITLVEGDSVTELAAGDAATFAAGVAIGHYLENRSALPTKCLVIGTRATVDRITYPDHDRVCHRNRREPDDVWTDLAGLPSESPHDG
jgi:uncharacterized cupin superfamily protein